MYVSAVFLNAFKLPFGHFGFDLQVAAYAGLDIAAKVFFGWMIMAAGPIITAQQDREYKE